MNFNGRIIPCIVILLILPILVSCGKKRTAWGGKVEEANGVTIVRNPRNPVFPENACSIEESLMIGGAESGKEYTFSEIADVAVDAEENVYVLDSKEALIKSFNKAGSYMGTIGRKGQGPGEMQRPTNLFITPANQILINDRGARLLHFFGRDGQHLRSISLARMPFFSRPKVDSQNNIVARFTTITPAGAATFTLAKFDSDLNELFRVFSYEYLRIPNTLNVYPPECFWALRSDDHIIWGFSDKYELQILNRSGRIVRKIIKDYKPIEITKKGKEEWARFAFGDSDVPSDIKVNWPEHHNAFKDIVVDDEGKIFVQTYEKAFDDSGYYYDVFDPEGRYLTRFPLKAPPRAIKKDKLYTIEENENGYQVVKRYKVTWSDFK